MCPTDPTIIGTLVPPKRRRDNYLVFVTCPYCGDRHTHGAPDGRADIGHRTANCSPGGGYYVVAPPAETPARG